MEKLHDLKYGLDLNNSSEGSERAEIMSKACQHSIEAAKKLISFFCRLYETDSIQKVGYSVFPYVTPSALLISYRLSP